MPGVGNEEASNTTRILTKKSKRGKQQKKTHKKGFTFKKYDNKWIKSNYMDEGATDSGDMHLLIHCNKMLNAHERRISDSLLVQQCFRAYRQDEQRRRRRHKKANKSDDELKENDEYPHPSLHLTVKI